MEEAKHIVLKINEDMNGYIEINGMKYVFDGYYRSVDYRRDKNVIYTTDIMIRGNVGGKLEE